MAIYENEFQSPLSTYSFVQNYLSDLAMLPARPTKCGTVMPAAASRQERKNWIKPQLGCMKINVDAAISRNNDRGSLVAICRDEQGLCMGASSVAVKDLVLEAMALREALSLAEDLYLRRIPIAIDCQAKINHIQGGYKGTSQAVIHDIKTKIEEFEVAHLHHDKREHNGEAHYLAKVATSLYLGRHVWLMNTPNFMYLPLSILVE